VSVNCKIAVGGCELLAQFRYTAVQIEPVPNPLFATVRALACLFPSGDGASADQIVSDPSLQPDPKTQTPTTMNKIALRRAEGVSINFMIARASYESKKGNFPRDRAKPLVI
jgi:hypothetical protein